MKRFFLLFVIISSSVLFAQSKSTKENHAPMFAREMNNTSISAGSAIQFTYLATDSDGDSVKYFAQTIMPETSILISSTGQFVWRPSLFMLGKNYIQIHATDGKDTTLSRITVVTVLDATTSDGGFRLFVDSKPAEGGLVLRSLTSSGATLVARANKGYRFTNWSTENSILSSDSNYSFPIKSGLFENDIASIYANFRVNHAPVFVKEMPDTTIAGGYNYFYTYKAVDPDGDSIKYYPQNTLPQNCVLLPTGFLGWRPGNFQLGKHEVRVIATDGNLSVLSRISKLNVISIQNVNGKEELPHIYSLSQNYPNPFNPSTTIEYTIPKAERVTLKVFDVLGREVETLVDEYKQAGNYKAIFNVETLRATSLPSGVYFYQLRAGSFAETKKFVLMK